MPTRLAIVALGVLFAGGAAADPLVKRNVVYYEVGGASAQEIRAELNRLGPPGSGKSRFDAHTRWHVKWTYRYCNSGDDCAIARVRTTVDATITMPRLKANAARPAAVTREFEEFAQKLMAHEEGRVQNAIEAANLIEYALQGIAPHPTCDAFGRVANALADSLVREANQKDVDHDARTEHGRNQGVRFPASP